MRSFRQLGIRFLTLAVLGVPSVCSAQSESGFRFLATGDVPYTEVQDVNYRRLLKQSESEDFAFLMHVGDFKAGDAPCSDEAFLEIRDLFRDYPKPIVYTPGDNEWTDCHKLGDDPVERLDKVRELFYREPTTLRLDALGAESQSRDPRFSTFVENYRFSKDRVMFIVAHIVGSGNNLREGDAPATAEFHERNLANMAFLRESFAAAIASDAPGVAIVIHANPNFEKGIAAGFSDFLGVMREFLSEYHRPVVCIHGDSHYYRIDKPFRAAAGGTFMHFTRLETFGSPNVAGVVVSVDASDPQVFSFRPYYLSED